MQSVKNGMLAPWMEHPWKRFWRFELAGIRSAYAGRPLQMLLLHRYQDCVPEQKNEKTNKNFKTAQIQKYEYASLSGVFVKNETYATRKYLGDNVSHCLFFLSTLAAAEV